MAAELGKGPGRVLVFEPLGDGGIAHYAYNLVQALLGEGSRPLLCTASRYEFSDKPWPPGSLRTSLFRLAFGLIRIVPGLDVEQGAAAALRRLLKLVEYPFNAVETVLHARLRGIRIIHLQTVNSVDVIVVLAARAAGMRLVTTVHNVNPLHGRMTGPHRRLLGLMYALSHRLVIHTDSGKREIQEIFGLAADKVVVIPHGDYSFFVAEQKAAAAVVPAGSGGNLLLFFGAIRPNKGLDVLLEAMPLILARHPDCRLSIVGEPVGDYTPYRDLIVSLGLTGAVDEYLGYVGNDEVAPHFNRACLVVLPYREITQSGVLQIAFACGTPVVASHLPGFAEVIDSGVNGILVPPADAEALAGACCDLLTHPERARGLGETARTRMQRDFAWDAIARRTEAEVYEALSRV